MLHRINPYTSKLFFVLLCCSVFSLQANDGAFYAEGNQLIPIVESDIALKKEVLAITRIDEERVRVDVNYQLYNPGAAKTILVGFEAASPKGDVNSTPKNGQHPYMSEFIAKLNQQRLPHQIAIVNEDQYYKDHKFITVDPEKYLENVNGVDFRYIYYFTANFQPGMNQLQHHYTFKLSGSLMEYESLNYILTAANRWANHQIDDFTLEIDLGEFSDFKIDNRFLTEQQPWIVNVDDKISAVEDQSLNNDYFPEKRSATHFYLRNGPLRLHLKNFKPQNELYLWRDSPYVMYEATEKKDEVSKQPKLLNLVYSPDIANTLLDELKNQYSSNVLRNLPFARRGYVFKNAELAALYGAQPWYQPNNDYQPSERRLLPAEIQFLKNCCDAKSN